VILLHSLYRRWRKRISSLIFCRWITYAWFTFVSLASTSTLFGGWSFAFFAFFFIFLYNRYCWTWENFL
jgi:hypothetical protein